MQVHLVNPSALSFGISVITPRWLYVLARATPLKFGDPVITDEMLEPFDVNRVRPGDVVGIGIHTCNALRGYELGRAVRKRGGVAVFGGVHATLYPNEAHEQGNAGAVVKGDGDRIWSRVLDDCVRGCLKAAYDGGKVEGEEFVPARWDLLPRDRYMWGSVQTLRGCPKHCSFCSVWRTDGQKPRQRLIDSVVAEIVELRRRGFRFILLADDNFYPVTLDDLRLAEQNGHVERLTQLSAVRRERFELMSQLAKLPDDLVFYTQITMEAAEDPTFLDAMRRARIRGVLVGVESVTPEGLKTVYKDFNATGKVLVDRLSSFQDHGIHVLGSFIFGLASDRPDTFSLTARVAQQARVAFAQFVMLTPFPGTVDFARWERGTDAQQKVGDIPLSRYWLIPPHKRPKIYASHPSMSADEICRRTQRTWDHFYGFRMIWERSKCVRSLRARLAFVLISKLYRQMYANTGIATDSARVERSVRWARWIARPCRRLFAARPMAHLRPPA